MRSRWSSVLEYGVRLARLERALRCALPLILLAFGSGPSLAAEENGESLEALRDRGQTILRQHCASCHAIGKTGESANEEAPPFRTLSENYPVEDLAESLAEGIMSGHPDMPVFVFEPRDVDAIIAYLQSIQSVPDAAPTEPAPAGAEG